MGQLRQISDGLWCAAERSRAYGVELGDRMTIVRLAGGELFVHAPIALSESLRAAADQRGEVRYLCAPNLRTCDHVRAWGEAYPEAERLGVPGALQQQRAVGQLSELGDEPAAEWQGELDQHLFRGIPTLNEVAFLHRPSRSLLLADLALNIPSSVGFLARAYLRLSLGGLSFGPPRDLRWLVTERSAAQRSVQHLLGWSFDRIIVRRGDLLERGAKQALRRAFEWLSTEPAWWQ